MKKLVSDSRNLYIYQEYLKKNEENKELKRELIIAEKYFKYEKQKLQHNLKKFNESISAYDAKIKAHMRLNDINSSLKLHLELQTCKPFFDESNEITAEIEKLKQESIAKKIQLQTLEESIHRSKNETDKMAGIMEFAGMIQKRLQMLEIISNSFGSYKHWLYNSRILPSLVEYINNLIQTVEENLSLKAELTDKNVIQFYIIDKSSNRISSRDNWIILAKASGFQKAIISIACRIGLNRIGACNIYCDELFLDEPFTSCDDMHLRKLRSLFSV